MKALDVSAFSTRYAVRRMCDADVPEILALERENTQYYDCCGAQPSEALTRSDLHITPPGIALTQKYYVGFWDGDTLVAVLDLIDGYPAEEIAFLGFFMLRRTRQGSGEGSRLVSELFSYLRACGFAAVQLGIDKGNPQSTHFWKKNGFRVLREVVRDGGVILYAERRL